jgi:hypothetical protein
MANHFSPRRFVRNGISLIPNGFAGGLIFSPGGGNVQISRTQKDLESIIYAVPT